MKALPLLFILLCISSCEKKAIGQGGGSVKMGGVVRDIKLVGLNQLEVIKELETWLIANGYKKPFEPWATFATKGEAVNAEGKRDSSYAYVKRLSKYEGSIAFRISLASEDEPYVTVYHVSKYEGDTKDELKQAAAEYSKISGNFTEFIDTMFEEARSPRSRLSVGS
ncbi:MAG: hypothetical protein Q7Q71_00705 [Verrucomicrobiota bacterium JB023]|nr:hypothetical protein [Verrucomicrobiota bacterium JB023]